MKKSIGKKLLGGVVALVIALSLFCPAGSAQADTYTVGFYQLGFTSDNASLKIYKYTGDEINCTIPKSFKINGKMYKVTEIDGSSFESKKYMQSVKIPSTVKKIGTWAFAYCNSLKKVNIPDSVTFVGAGIFKNCVSLEKVKIGSGLTDLGDGAAIMVGMFSGCTSLKNVSLPDSLKTINDYSFTRCSSLQKITIPNSVTRIGSCAFASSGLVSLKIPDKVKKIGGSICSGCKDLKSVTIGKRVISIPIGAFDDCNSLKEVTFLGNNVRRFGGGWSSGSVFGNCTSLTSITIPESVERIDRDAFENCTNLSEINLNEGLGILENAFGGCTSLYQLTIPSTVYKLSVGYGTSLNNVVLKSSYLEGPTNSATLSLPKNTSITYYDTADNNIKKALQNGVEKYNYNLNMVPGVQATGIKLGKQTLSITVGSSQKVSWKLTPSNTTDCAYWESSNTEIAQVSQLGKIYAIKSGSAIITARTRSGQVAQVSVVCQEAPTSLRISATNVIIKKGKTKKLRAIVDDGSRTDVKVTWTSSKKSVATVSSKGRITAKKKGTCTITAKTYNGLKAKCKVTVK